MNIVKLSKLACLFALSSQCLFAAQHKGDSHPFGSSSSSSSSSSCCQECNLGSVRFFVADSSLWYNISAPNFPSSVLLSRNSNQGFKEGDVRVTSTGLKINESGNYSVTFTAVLQSNNPTDTLFIPVFVSVNSVFDPFTTTTVGSVAILPPNGSVGTVQASGILCNVKKGSTLSLVATNTSTPNTETLTIVNWSLSAFKIPRESH